MVRGKERNKFGKLINLVGSLLLTLAVFFGLLTFGPAVKEEVRYQVKQSPSEPVKQLVQKKDLTPKNTNFWIVVPKIDASAPVVADVDPSDKSAYLSALTKGVAHAAGTSFPGSPGNTYIFAHSTDSFYNVGRYNAVFYLLGKLAKGDTVEIYYKGEKILYIVREVKTVSADAVEYLGDLPAQSGLEGNTLTLQTCYPPGTTLKRLIVIADQLNKED